MLNLLSDGKLKNELLKQENTFITIKTLFRRNVVLRHSSDDHTICQGL